MSNKFIPWLLVCHFSEFEELWQLSKCNKLLSRVVRDPCAWDWFEMNEYKLTQFFRTSTDGRFINGGGTCMMMKDIIAFYKFLNGFIIHIYSWIGVSEPSFNFIDNMRPDLKKSTYKLVNIPLVDSSAAHILYNIQDLFHHLTHVQFIRIFTYNPYFQLCSLGKELKSLSLTEVSQNLDTRLNLFLNLTTLHIAFNPYILRDLFTLSRPLVHITHLNVELPPSWYWIVMTFPSVIHLKVNTLTDTPHPWSLFQPCTEPFDTKSLFVDFLNKLEQFELFNNCNHSLLDEILDSPQLSESIKSVIKLTHSCFFLG
ncbi:MAG: hypothetical protein Sylvanvirus25_5 [Sylvanvirus sp.]|uniref:F-box domain-containing protein n=1 Tax=Sylvanvirus sp. TaxID=2487774 RepID=A0A3G5ALA8_9VIRU|nr:MAG: hypothetical protein Sylvanvirus25_5 [Sylvanvirus sp.]